MSVNARVTCPRCGRVWVLPYPTNETSCICEQYCEDGDKPGDCAVAPYNYTGGLGYPMGASTSNEDRGDDKLHATGYCSTHNKYIYKDKIIIEVSWDEYLRKRIEPGSRLSDWRKA